MSKRFKVLAVNDEADCCECCGKSGLKRVVWIEDTETGTIRHFGVICALAPAKGFEITKAEIAKATREHDAAVAKAAREAASARWMELYHVTVALYELRGGTFRKHTCANGYVCTLANEGSLYEACKGEVLAMAA